MSGSARQSVRSLVVECSCAFVSLNRCRRRPFCFSWRRDRSRFGRRVDGRAAQQPTMEWSHEASLRLIDEYERAPMLWDSKNPNYYSKTRKQEAWDAVAARFNTDVDELKKKLNSLLGSFRRERMKHRRQVALGREYVSKWFAYDKMKFLLDVRDNSDDIDMMFSGSDHQENVIGEDEVETFLESPESSSLVATSLEPMLSGKSGYKRVKTEEEKYLISPQMHDPRTAYINNGGYEPSYDEFDALGKIVATRCRQMQTSQRIVAEKLINDVLYCGQLEQLSAESCVQLNTSVANCVRSPDDGSFFKGCDI